MMKRAKMKTVHLPADVFDGIEDELVEVVKSTLRKPTYYLKMTQKQIGPYEFPSAANFPEIDGREYCIIRNFWR